MKRYFKLDYEKISNIIFFGSQKIAHQGSEKTDTNKKLNNKSSSTEKLLTQKELDEKYIEFRNEVRELRDIIINTTGENPVNI